MIPHNRNLKSRQKEPLERVKGSYNGFINVAIKTDRKNENEHFKDATKVGKTYICQKRHCFCIIG